MKVIIPAAGIGKRLQPLTFFYPKPLLYLGTKRMIDYIMNSFKDTMVTEVIMVVGYKREMLEDYLRKNYKQNFTFVYQENQAGLGDAILLGIEKSEVNEREDLLVILSDTIVDINMKKFTKKGKTKIAVKRVSDPQSFGIVETEGTTIRDMYEKPEKPISDLAIVGLYYFADINKIQESLNHIKNSGIKTKNEFQLTDAMKYLLESGESMEAFVLKQWIDCGNFDMFIDSNKELLKREKIKNYYQKASISDSVLEENVSLFDNVTVKNSKLKNTVVFPNSIIENCSLNNSIIGENCIIKNFKGKIICSDKTIIN